jgi:hypothetical protein
MATLARELTYPHDQGYRTNYRGEWSGLAARHGGTSSPGSAETVNGPLVRSIAGNG